MEFELRKLEINLHSNCYSVQLTCSCAEMSLKILVIMLLDFQNTSSKIIYLLGYISHASTYS